MSSKPDFIIVPGAWHAPSAFNPTTTLLEKAGYTVHGVNLASYGASPPLQTFDQDVSVIRSKIESVLKSGKDVVLIYHSYGSVPGSEALAEYLKTVNTEKIREGKIRRLVFCTSFILSEGGSLSAALGGKDLPWFQVNGDEVTPENPAAVFYNDLDSAAAEKAVSELKPHSYKTFASAQTVAPWKNIPSTYILCTEDQAIPLPVQEGMIAAAKEAAPDAFDVIEKCNASHSPFLSQPEWLAEKFIEAAQ